MFFGKKPSLAYAHRFGCTAWYHVPKEKRKKLVRKAHKGIFVGYSDMAKGFEIFIPDIGHIALSCDVTFIEIEDSNVLVSMPFEEGEKDENHHVVEEVPIQPYFQIEESLVEATDEHDGPLEENFELDGNEATDPAPIGRRIPRSGIDPSNVIEGP